MLHVQHSAVSPAVPVVMDNIGFGFPGENTLQRLMLSENSEDPEASTISLRYTPAPGVDKLRTSVKLTEFIGRSFPTLSLPRTLSTMLAFSCQAGEGCRRLWRLQLTASQVGWRRPSVKLATDFRMMCESVVAG